jgi:hypothetical protein
MWSELVHPLIGPFSAEKATGREPFQNEFCRCVVLGSGSILNVSSQEFAEQ